MTGLVDNWDVLDDLITKEEAERKEQEIIKNDAARRPKTATASTAARDDWLGLRPNSNKNDAENNIMTSSYEPSSSRGGVLNTSRRLNLRRQSTQQHQRASRSAGLLLFSDDDDDGDGDEKTRNNSTAGGEKKPTAVAGRLQAFDPFAETRQAAANEDAMVDHRPQAPPSKRRETSPSITVTAAAATAAKTDTAENMPSWLTGLIQHKDETPPSPPIVMSTNKSVPIDVQKSGGTENKTADEKTVSIASLLKQKDGLQTSTMEFIQELAKKQQDIQQATIALIQEQQNSDILIKTLFMDNSSSVICNTDKQELERLRSDNHNFQLTIDHLTKKYELELDTLKTKYELQQNVLREKLNFYEEHVNELEEGRKADMAERKENELRLKEMYEDRLRAMHESHLEDFKLTAEVQKIKIDRLEQFESDLREESTPKRRPTTEELTAKEISIAAHENKLKDLQKEIDKQMAALEGEKSAFQMKTEEFESRNQRERNELEVDRKELKRLAKALEDERKTWEREKKSETQYIESRIQELEAVRLSVIEEQRKLAEERFEVASERYKLESMLKLDIGTGSKNLLQAKVEVKENFKELKKKEKELEKRLEHVKELEKRLEEERQKLLEQDDKIKMKTIRTEKMLKIAISKQEEGLKTLENAKDIQNKFDKKGNDIQNRLLDVIKREENLIREENKLAQEREAFNKQIKKLDFVLPQLSSEEMRFFHPKLNRYEAEKDIYYKKAQL